MNWKSSSRPVYVTDWPLSFLTSDNAGPGAVQQYGGIPPYKETREYVRRIKILYRRYRSSES